MFHYIVCAPGGAPKGHISRTAPLIDPVGPDQSAQNSKDYYLAAEMVDPPLDAGLQVKSGPVYETSPAARIVYTVEYRAIEDVRREMKKRAAREFQKRSLSIVDGYSENERATWPVQLAEAQAVAADAAAAAPMLTELATQRAMTVADLAQTVLAKAAGFRAAAVPYLAAKSALFDLIEGSETPSAAASVDLTAGWPT